jgi:hypothetical protein
LTVAWLELRAEQIIDDATTWVPIQSSLRRPTCTSCKHRLEQRSQSELRQKEEAERSFAYAKSNLIKAVERWLQTGAVKPNISIRCERCGKGRECVVSSLFRKTITAALADYEFPGGRIADLVLTDGNAPLMAIFIRAANGRSAKLVDGIFDCPWVELSEARLQSHPLYWLPINSSFRGMICALCRDANSDDVSTLQRAQKEIKATVENWLHNQGDSPKLINKCCLCRREHPQMLPPNVRKIVDDPEGLALTASDGSALLKIRFTENLFTFPYVDPRNREQAKVHWIQLNVYEVLKNSMIWKPIDEDLKKCVCVSCRQARNKCSGQNHPP